jgi:monoamine oxidase
VRLAGTEQFSSTHRWPLDSRPALVNHGAMSKPKICIIGAGCSGFTTAKRLKDENIPFDVFEASDDIGHVSLL